MKEVIDTPTANYKLNRRGTRLCSVQETRNYFYDALENGSKGEMADWFETLYLHYVNRGRLRFKIHMLDKTQLGNNRGLCTPYGGYVVRATQHSEKVTCKTCKRLMVKK